MNCAAGFGLEILRVYRFYGRLAYYREAQEPLAVAKSLLTALTVVVCFVCTSKASHHALQNKWCTRPAFYASNLLPSFGCLPVPTV